MISNYHTHTWRCRHAVGKEKEFVENAIRSGLKTFGFSDHSPYPFPGGYCSGFRMFMDNTENYFRTVTDLKSEYKNDIDIHAGLEAEYYPAYFDKLIRHLENYPCEYLLLGQHFIMNEIDEGAVYSGSRTEDPAILKQYVDQVSEAIGTGRYLYIAHPDLLNFAGDPDVFDREYRRLCENAKKADIPLEINLLGVGDNRHYPNDSFWKIVSEVGNKVVIGIDAHSPEAVLFKNVLRKAECNITEKYGIVPESSLTLKEHI